MKHLKYPQNNGMGGLALVPGPRRQCSVNGLRVILSSREKLPQAHAVSLLEGQGVGVLQSCDNHHPNQRFPLACHPA